MKKLWDELVFELQAVNATVDNQRKGNEIIRDATAATVAHLEEAGIEQEDEGTEEANVARATACNALNEHRAGAHHKATCKTVKELQAKKKSKESASLKMARADLNTFLRTRQGRC
jgi:hypothetical protein